MWFVVAGITLIFVASGIVVLQVSLRELAGRLRYHHRFQRTQGEIVDIKTTLRWSSSSRTTHYSHFPIISFRTPDGKEITFTSETGDAGKHTRYQVGQILAVRYDPLGAFKPMLDSWSGVWLPNLMGVAASFGFMLGAAMIWVFGMKVFVR